MAMKRAQTMVRNSPALHKSLPTPSWQCLPTDVKPVPLFVQRKAAIEAKNEAETMIYSAERSVSEYKDKVPQTVVDAINAAIGDVRGALESESAEEIKAKSNALQQAIMKIGESMSQQGGKTNMGGLVCCMCLVDWSPSACMLHDSLRNSPAAADPNGQCRRVPAKRMSVCVINQLLRFPGLQGVPQLLEPPVWPV